MRSTLKPRYDGVKTGSLNQAVKRNIDRFPEDFMFRLNMEVAVQLEAINDALDQLRDTKVTPRKPIGFKTQKNDK